MRTVLIFLLCWVFTASALDKELLDHHKKVEKKRSKKEKLEPGWNSELQSSINVTQSSSVNWKAGDSNVFVWLGNINGSTILDTVKYSWANYLKILYGTSSQNGQQPRKNNDLLEIESVFSFKNKKFLNPYLSLDFRSQFAPGYKYSDESKEQVSDIFDPAYLVNGFGVGYEKDRLLRTRIGIASRLVFTNRYNSFADGNHIKYDAGLQWVSRVEKHLLENCLLKTKLDVFTSLEDMREVNLNWDTNLELSVISYVVVNLQTLVVYNPQFSSKAQIKEILSVGLKYDFI